MSRRRAIGAVLLAPMLLAVPAALPAQATLRVIAADVELPAAEAADYAARATRPAAIEFVINGCSGPAGCTLAVWAPAAAQDLEWQLDATLPGGWRPVAALPSSGEALRLRGARQGVIFVRARLDWERAAPLPSLGVVRLSLAAN